jgi:hypothetical protein
VEKPNETELAKVISNTMELWMTLSSGDERLAAAWLLGTALDWSLDLGLETRQITDALFRRVSAYLKTQANGKEEPP